MRVVWVRVVELPAVSKTRSNWGGAGLAHVFGAGVDGIGCAEVQSLLKTEWLDVYQGDVVDALALQGQQGHQADGA